MGGIKMKKLLLILAAIFVPFMAIGQSLTTTYEYDELNRLVKVNYPNGQRVEYEYDVLGNRLSRTVTQDTYLITAVVTPETAGTVEGAGNYAPGTEATLAATANEGYSFANWTENGETVSTTATYTFTVNAARNLVANFTQSTYEVMATAAPENGGTITGAGTYVHGDTVTLTANANAGYTFINWTENGEVVSTEPTCSFVVTAAHTFVAHFSINSYAVSVEATPEEGGTVTGEGVFNYGATATLTATANPGYTFYNWTMNGQQVSTNATYNFTVTAEATYVAHFSLNTYLITAIANPTAGGTVSGGGNYAHGSTVTLNAVPSDDYEFVNWTKNGQQVSDSETYSFPVQESGTYIAHFTLKSYAITALANPESGGTVTGAGDYVFGATATLTATSNEGYTFQNWAKDGEVVSTESTYSFEVTGDASYVANFALNSYEITATANPVEGGTVTGSGTYNYGANVTLTATANEGYTFQNWAKDGEVVSTEASYSFEVTDDASYVANFTLNSYEITATANPVEGGTVSGSGTYDFGTTATLTATANAGYTFINWTKDGVQVSANSTYSITVTEGGTYVANFGVNAPDTYIITAVANPEAGGTVTGSGIYDFGTTATLTATANEGYTFQNWAKDGEVVSTEASYSFEVTDDASYVANFTLNSYEITATANPTEGGTVSGSGTYDYGASVTLTATANEGYTFQNWAKDGEIVSTEASYSFEVTGDASYVANFALNSYEITAMANPTEGGTVSGSGTYDYGANVTLTATANEGYTFINWTLDGEEVSTSETYSFEVTGDAIYVANFVLNSYEIIATANPTEGGTVSGSGTYDFGTTATLTATANVGYTFINWTKDGEVFSTDAAYSFEVTGDASYVANFALNSYEITATANPTEGGTVSGSGTYDFGTTATLTATANVGYTFINWAKDGEVVSTEASYSFEVTGDASYVANFALNSYEITATANPTEGGTVTGSGAYDFGTTATLTATANEGYTFQNWAKDGEVVSTETVYSFEVTRDASYVANYTLNSYEITAMANPTEGGTVSGSGTYNYGANVTLTATANEGYTFINWTKDGVQVSANSTYSFTVTEGGAYVANFGMNAPDTYIITAVANPEEGGTVSGSGTYDFGTTATLTAMSNEGYTFQNWAKDGEVVSTESTYSFEVTGDAIYVANFVLNSYEITVTASPVEGGTVSGSGTYDHGATAALTAIANEGYTFINWTKDGVQVSANSAYSLTVTEGGAYVANFGMNAPDTYIITAVANPEAGGTVTGSGTYDFGTTATLTAMSNEGYIFQNWAKDGEVVSTVSTYSFEVTGDAIYVANFALNSYEITVTANPTEGGTVSGSGTYDYGSNVTLTATVNEGYTFINWTKDGVQVSANSTYSFTVTEGGAYVANFGMNAPDTYIITAMANPEAGGTVTGSGAYDFGTTATLTATANEGYTFQNWAKDGEVVSTEASYSFEVTDDASYVANFTLNSYEITATANPVEGGTVSGSGTYNYGANVTLTATANAGYTFINWTKDGVQVSANMTYSFTVTEGGTYVANFGVNTPDTYIITAVANPEEGGTVSGSGTYDFGTTATLTATANEGYTFQNWAKNGEVVSTEASYSFEVTGDASYVANFALNSYEITAMANPTEGGTVSGSGTYNYGANVTLTATANEGYTFINWTKDGVQVSANSTYSITVTEGGAYVANFELMTITQATNFVEGWNWWSSYVELDGIDGLNMLQDGLGTCGVTIKSQNDGFNSYLDGFGWYGQLITINNESTYQIRASSSCVVNFTGIAANPSDHPITLNSGWTWMGYPVPNSMSLEDALAGFAPVSGDLLKSQNNGFASYFEGIGWYGELNTLYPGMGLMYKSNKGTAITFTYPNSGAKGELKPNQTSDDNHWQPNLNAYSDNMSVMAVVEVNDEELRSENYELAAFANGECRGSSRLLYVEPLDRYMAFLTVAGDEAAELHFGLYNTETGEEYHNATETLTYETNAVVGGFTEPYVISFRGTTGVDEWARDLNIYPNPVEKGQAVRLGFNDEERGEVRVEIMNAQGVVVEIRRATSLQTITAPNVAGVYTLRITVEGKGTCYRKLVVE